MKKLLSDSYFKTIQFSKVLICVCMIIGFILFGLVPFLTIAYSLDVSVACALIAASGTMIMTAVVFYMKKSQAENTVKIYIGAVEKIARIKQQHNGSASAFIEGAEEHILNKMTDNINAHLDDATSLIEKQEVPLG